MNAMLKTTLWSAASVLMSVAVAGADPLYINAVNIDVVPGQIETTWPRSRRSAQRL